MTKCLRCKGHVEKETDADLVKEYPYYCPYCDENMYRFETFEGGKRLDESRATAKTEH